MGFQHSNPNLLDNWYFVDPINQRGQMEYTAFNATQKQSDEYSQDSVYTPGGRTFRANI